MAHESWLALDQPDHDKFGEAMLLCQDASGWCVRNGRCFYDGDCFHGGFATYRKAAREIRHLADEHSGAVGQALREAAEHMETMARCAKDES
jgi:hypothetical protein